MEESRLYLKFPSIEDKENVLDFKNEFLQSGQETAGDAGLDRIATFEEWLAKVQNDVNIKPGTTGRVAATLYLVYRKEDDRLVGMIQIRHQLNDYLLRFGGHIGGCVRPSEQRKGYSNEQLSLVLKKCEELGIDRVLMTCDKNNTASAKSIQRNNGVLEDEVQNENEITQRYWIEIPNTNTLGK